MIHYYLWLVLKYTSAWQIQSTWTAANNTLYLKYILDIGIRGVNITIPMSSVYFVYQCPVCIFTSFCILTASAAKTPILDCSKYLLTEEDIKTDELAARMLMYNPWRHEKHGYVWKDTTPVPHEKQ